MRNFFVKQPLDFYLSQLHNPLERYCNMNAKVAPLALRILLLFVFLVPPARF